MSTHAPWLTTDRLALRRFTADDLDWFADLYSDEEFARYLGGAKTRAQAGDLMTTRALQYYDAHPGLGMWVTVDRTGGAPLGFHLLNHIQGESIIQVGFGLSTAAQGKGFATEMASALLRHGFVDLKLDRIAGMADTGNLASQRVLARIGLQRNGERSFPHPAYAASGPLAWFERDAPAWIAEHATAPI